MMSSSPHEFENGWRVKSEGMEAWISLSRKWMRPGSWVMLPCEFVVVGRRREIPLKEFEAEN